MITPHGLSRGYWTQRILINYHIFRMITGKFYNERFNSQDVSNIKTRVWINVIMEIAMILLFSGWVYSTKKEKELMYLVVSDHINHEDDPYPDFFLYDNRRDAKFAKINIIGSWMDSFFTLPIRHNNTSWKYLLIDHYTIQDVDMQFNWFNTFDTKELAQQFINNETRGYIEWIIRKVEYNKGIGIPLFYRVLFAPESPDPYKWRADYWDISDGSIYPIGEVWGTRLIDENGKDWGARIYYITIANNREDALVVGKEAILNFLTHREEENVES